MENSKIIEPCFLGENVVISNSTVGPHVSVGAGTKIENSTVRNSIIQQNAKIDSSTISNSMLGNYTEVKDFTGDLSLGDYSVIKKV
jgi:glucose-1-phosphate thymidylyltransferase